MITIADSGIHREGQHIQYLWFQVHDHNCRDDYFRAVALMELAAIPVSIREDYDLISKQHAAVRGLYNAEVDFVYSASGIFTPEHIGIVQYYAGAGLGRTRDESAAIALRNLAAVRSTLANYEQSRLEPPNPTYVEWYIDFVTHRSHNVVALLGHPDPRETRRGLGRDGEFANDTGDDLAAEQNEILFRGMAKLRKDFIYQVTARRLDYDFLSKGLERVAQVASNMASRQRGSINFGFSLAIPIGMMLGQATAGGHAASTSSAHSTAEGVSHGWGNTHTDGQAHTESQSSTTGGSETHTCGTSHTEGTAHTDSASNTQSEGISVGESTTRGSSSSWASGTSTNASTGVSTNESTGASSSHAESSADNWSAGESSGRSAGQSAGMTVGEGSSWSEGTSASVGSNMGASTGASSSVSESTSLGANASVNANAGLRAQPMVAGTQVGDVTAGMGGSVGVSGSQSWGQTAGTSVTNNVGVSTSMGASSSVGGSASSAASVGSSMSMSEGVSSSVGGSAGITDGTGTSSSVGSGTSSSVGTGTSSMVGGSDMVAHSNSVSRSSGSASSQGTADTRSVADGVSESHSVSRSWASSRGTADTISQADGVSENWGQSRSQGEMLGMSLGRSLSQGYSSGLSSGLVPGFSIGRSLQTEDDLAIVTTDLLRLYRAQAAEASAEGGFMTDAVIFTDDDEGATAARALVPQAFHGPNVPVPVLTIQPRGDEAQDIRDHALAFLHYEGADQADPLGTHFFTRASTMLVPRQLAALTAPGIFEEGTAMTVMAPIPRGIAFYPNMPGDVVLGHQYSPETAELTTAPVRLDQSRLMHTMFAGDTGWGKSVAAITMAYETTLRWHTRTVVLDFGAGWRQLLNAPGLEGHVDVLQLWPDAVRPFRWNPLQIGRQINPETQWRAFADIFGSIAKLGVRRQKQELLQALRAVYIRAGVLIDDSEVRADQEWGRIKDQEEEIAGAPVGTPLGNLTRDQRQRLAVLRSSRVGLIDLYNEVEVKRDAVNPRDTMLQGVLDGIIQRMNPLVQGAAASQFAAGPSATPLEDLARPWGIAIIEGGIFLDDFGKAFLLGWAGWHLYTDMIARRVNEVTGEPLLQIVFEEANKIFGGVGDGGGEDDGGGISTSQRFGDMFRDARKYHCRLHVITQAPAMIPPDIISSCNNLALGFLKNPKDKDIVLSAIARSEKGFRDEEWRRFIANQPIGMILGRFPYTDNRELQQPVLFKPRMLDMPEPTDADIEAMLGRIAL